MAHVGVEQVQWHSDDSPPSAGGPVAVLTLDDPDRRNALSPALCDELTAAVEAAEQGGAGAIVVTGAGPAFCAGADLSDLGASREEGLRRIYAGFLAVARSPLPTVAAVNGPAVGAGMNLALACDVRLVGPRARFDCRFLDLGIHPGGGHTWMLRHIVGPQAAAALLLFGQVADADEAVRIGLAWESTDAGTLVERAVALAARAASMPPGLVRAAKATLAAVAALDDHDEAVDLELARQVRSMDDPAFGERLAALQRRISSS
jgi:enoyl-CoA hydratase